MDQLPFSSSLTNATAYLPSPADLLLVFPRLLYRAGLVPDQLDGLIGKIRSGGPTIAGPTGANVTNATLLSSTLGNTANTFVQQSTAAATATAGATSPQNNDYDMVHALKHVSTLLGYITTKYAIATMVTAIMLNRTQFYASSRIPLSFRRLHVRLVLYIVPILMFLYRVQTMLRAMRCQTSPTWSSMQYGKPGAYLDVDFAGEGGFLFKMSSALLFHESLESSCAAVGMVPTAASTTRASGSLSLIWPFFLSLAFSTFIETLSCALQGRRPLHETGMTLFEHSLAFAEADALVTKPLSVDWAQLLKPRNVLTPSAKIVAVPRSQLLSMANVPPDVLLLSIISSFSHLTSHVLAMLGLRAKLRLITTSIWASAYMSALMWMFLRAANLPSQGLQKGVIRFPIMCAMGFLPHMFIILGILACGTIYALAFILTVLSPPPGHPPASLRERFSVAYRNLHANIHLSAITPITISMQDDFYTAIIKIGFTILTAASEAVYLNEGTKVKVQSMTWLEKKKLTEYLARRRRFRQSLIPVPPELLRGSLGESIELVDIPGTNASSTTVPSSGYARERKTQQKDDRSTAHKRAVGPDGGVGARQREGRFLLAYQFLNSIFRLLMAIHARAALVILRSLRIAYSPAWLRRFAGPDAGDETGRKTSSTGLPPWARSNQPWSWVDEQMQERPLEDLDVEEYVRDGLRRTGTYDDWGPEHGEELMDHYLYSWWKQGGQWGEVDTSGDYQPSQDDVDDITSVVSMSNAETDSEWSDIEDGQRTPTQAQFSRTSRESTPQPATLDISRLAHLLDPKTREDREEARLLSRSLQSQGIMTRSRFRKETEKEEMRLLTSSRLPIPLPTDAQMRAEDEEKVLEAFILDRRGSASHSKPTTSTATGTGSWNSGAEGMGAEGPQCVVCQLSPRTILVWPCGCLSLCDECRVGLAAKNYTTCVCCRSNVVAYSRLYVP